MNEAQQDVDEHQGHDNTDYESISYPSEEKLLQEASNHESSKTTKQENKEEDNNKFSDEPLKDSDGTAEDNENMLQQGKDHDDSDGVGDTNDDEHQEQGFPQDSPLPPPPPKLHILLDAGYGLPRESRPRQEKILAIAKQIHNFLHWQQKQQQQHQLENLAPVTVIGCSDNPDMQQALQERLHQLWTKEHPEATTATTESLPDNFSFATNPDQETHLFQDAVYLSPDAPVALDPSRHPPTKVIVGLLIDRRVQLNRSLQRAETLGLVSKCWPMEVVDTDDQYHAQEPLNVDTILEALQQWSWNYDCPTINSSSNTNVEQLLVDDTAFRQASLQAFQHHAQRHPARPKHRPI